ncbi:TIGR03086 family protein [Aeromicrobium phragmitis]|uniref:TIGR03086 family protein n=1 Tax=Aeromicrobium phragmitis TaxID=2478914 RepID=A0A3L8PQ73_9ACTN|nr:TIGR03086 family metal-binding protein [Aeromicrobium phragmitis]RLV57344.1 TIGR03086 family protein [Aeromicrobium phragmitis]
MIDLRHAVSRTATVARNVTDEQLSASTPAEEMDVARLIHHLLGLTVAFRDAAGKIEGPTTATAPEPVDAPLPDEWRTLLHEQLDDLAAAWEDPAAWDGMTMVGGVELPAHVCGLVALDEVLLHGWDLARATDQDYQVSEEEAESIVPIVTPEDDDPQGRERAGVFGPVKPVPADAPLFDRVLAMAGRDPQWRASR